jgi:hypothetical protein
MGFNNMPLRPLPLSSDEKLVQQYADVDDDVAWNKPPFLGNAANLEGYSDFQTNNWMFDGTVTAAQVKAAAPSVQRVWTYFGRPDGSYWSFDSDDLSVIPLIVQYCYAHELDGMFLDGEPSEDWLTALRAAADRLLIITNSTPPSAFTEDYTAIVPPDEAFYRDDWLLPLVDGTVIEVTAPEDNDLWSVSYSLEWRRRMFERNQKIGKTIQFSVAWTNNQEFRVMHWAFYLLFQQGLAAFARQGEWDFPEVHIPVGTPLSDAVLTGTVWTREYTGATVSVDFGDGTSTTGEAHVDAK